MSDIRIENNEIIIIISSIIKKGPGRRFTIHEVNKLSKNELIKKIMVCAGAGAEYCCEKYGDIFNPNDIVKQIITIAQERGIL